MPDLFEGAVRVSGAPQPGSDLFEGAIPVRGTPAGKPTDELPAPIPSLGSQIVDAYNPLRFAREAKKFGLIEAMGQAGDRHAQVSESVLGNIGLGTELGYRRLAAVVPGALETGLQRAQTDFAPSNLFGNPANVGMELGGRILKAVGGFTNEDLKGGQEYARNLREGVLEGGMPGSGGASTEKLLHQANVPTTGALPKTIQGVAEIAQMVAQGHGGGRILGAAAEQLKLGRVAEQIASSHGSRLAFTAPAYVESTRRYLDMVQDKDGKVTPEQVLKADFFGALQAAAQHKIMGLAPSDKIYDVAKYVANTAARGVKMAALFDMTSKVIDKTMLPDQERTALVPFMFENPKTGEKEFTPESIYMMLAMEFMHGPDTVVRARDIASRVRAKNDPRGLVGVLQETNTRIRDLSREVRELTNDDFSLKDGADPKRVKEIGRQLQDAHEDARVISGMMQSPSLSFRKLNTTPDTSSMLKPETLQAVLHAEDRWAREKDRAVAGIGELANTYKAHLEAGGDAAAPEMADAKKAYERIEKLNKDYDQQIDNARQHQEAVQKGTPEESPFWNKKNGAIDSKGLEKAEAAASEKRSKMYELMHELKRGPELGLDYVYNMIAADLEGVPGVNPKLEAQNIMKGIDRGRARGLSEEARRKGSQEFVGRRNDAIMDSIGEPREVRPGYTREAFRELSVNDQLAAGSPSGRELSVADELKIDATSRVLARSATKAADVGGNHEIVKMANRINSEIRNLESIPNASKRVKQRIEDLKSVLDKLESKLNPPEKPEPETAEVTEPAKTEKPEPEPKADAPTEAKPSLKEDLERRVQEVRAKRKAVAQETRTTPEPPAQGQKTSEQEQKHAEAVEKLTPGEKSMLRNANKIGRWDIERMAAIKVEKDGKGSDSRMRAEFDSLVKAGLLDKNGKPVDPKKFGEVEADLTETKPTAVKLQKRGETTPSEDLQQTIKDSIWKVHEESARADGKTPDDLVRDVEHVLNGREVAGSERYREAVDEIAGFVREDRAKTESKPISPETVERSLNGGKDLTEAQKRVVLAEVGQKKWSKSAAAHLVKAVHEYITNKVLSGSTAFKALVKKVSTQTKNALLALGIVVGAHYAPELVKGKEPVRVVDIGAAGIAVGAIAVERKRKVREGVAEELEEMRKDPKKLDQMHGDYRRLVDENGENITRDGHIINGDAMVGMFRAVKADPLAGYETSLPSKDLHSRVVNAMFDGLNVAKKDGLPAKVFIMSGGAGAGKSVMARALFDSNTDGNTQLGQKYQNRVWILDSPGRRGHLEWYAERLAVKHGADVEIVHVTAPLLEAIENATYRVSKEGRAVDPDYLMRLRREMRNDILDARATLSTGQDTMEHVDSGKISFSIVDNANRDGLMSPETYYALTPHEIDRISKEDANIPLVDSYRTQIKLANKLLNEGKISSEAFDVLTENISKRGMHNVTAPAQAKAGTGAGSQLGIPAGAAKPQSSPVPVRGDAAAGGGHAKAVGGVKLQKAGLRDAGQRGAIALGGDELYSNIKNISGSVGKVWRKINSVSKTEIRDIAELARRVNLDEGGEFVHSIVKALGDKVDDSILVGSLKYLGDLNGGAIGPNGEFVVPRGLLLQEEPDMPGRELNKLEAKMSGKFGLGSPTFVTERQGLSFKNVRPFAPGRGTASDLGWAWQWATAMWKAGSDYASETLHGIENHDGRGGELEKAFKPLLNDLAKYDVAEQMYSKRSEYFDAVRKLEKKVANAESEIAGEGSKAGKQHAEKNIERYREQLEKAREELHNQGKVPGQSKPLTPEERVARKENLKKIEDIYEKLDAKMKEFSENPEYSDVRIRIAMEHSDRADLPDWLKPVITEHEWEISRKLSSMNESYKGVMEQHGVPTINRAYATRVGKHLLTEENLNLYRRNGMWPDEHVDPESIRFAHRESGSRLFYPGLALSLQSGLRTTSRIVSGRALANKWNPYADKIQTTHPRLAEAIRNMVDWYNNRSMTMPKWSERLLNIWYTKHLMLAFSVAKKHAMKMPFNIAQIGLLPTMQGLIDTLHAGIGHTMYGSGKGGTRSQFVTKGEIKYQTVLSHTMRKVNQALEISSGIPMTFASTRTGKVWEWAKNNPVQMVELFDRGVTFFATMHDAQSRGLTNRQFLENLIRNTMSINFMGIDTAPYMQNPAMRALMPLQQAPQKLMELNIENAMGGARAMRELVKLGFEKAGKDVVADRGVLRDEGMKALRYFAVLGFMSYVVQEVLDSEVEEDMTHYPRLMKFFGDMGRVALKEQGFNVAAPKNPSSMMGSLVPAFDELMQNQDRYGTARGALKTIVPDFYQKATSRPDAKLYGTGVTQTIRKNISQPRMEAEHRAAEERYKLKQKQRERASNKYGMSHDIGNLFGTE